MTKESDIQIACNEYLNYLGKYYFFRHFHVPNEGKRSISYHAKMKKMGLKSGCPDIIIEYPEGRVLYIELKNEKGRLSDSLVIGDKPKFTPYVYSRIGVLTIFPLLRLEEHNQFTKKIYILQYFTKNYLKSKLDKT